MRIDRAAASGVHPLLKGRVPEEYPDEQSLVGDSSPLLSLRVRRLMEAVPPPEPHLRFRPERLCCLRSLACERQERHELPLPVPERLEREEPKQLEYQPLHREPELLWPLRAELEAHSVAADQHHADQPQRVCPVVQTLPQSVPVPTKPEKECCQRDLRRRHPWPSPGRHNKSIHTPPNGWAAPE